MNEENSVVQFDEQVDISEIPSCWRCSSSDIGTENTVIENNSVLVDYVCNDCHSTWEVVFEPTTLFVAEQ